MILLQRNSIKRGALAINVPLDSGHLVDDPHRAGRSIVNVFTHIFICSQIELSCTYFYKKSRICFSVYHIISATCFVYNNDLYDQTIQDALFISISHFLCENKLHKILASVTSLSRAPAMPHSFNRHEISC